MRWVGDARWTAMLGAAAVAAIALALLRMLAGAPKPLLLHLALGLLPAAALAWALTRRCQPRPGRLALGVLAAWVLLAGGLLGSVRGIDRSGWIWLRLSGSDVVRAEDLSEQVRAPLDAFLARYPAFREDPLAPGGLLLPRGEHVVDETVIVPEGSRLRIEPGTVLRFAAGRSLVSYGPIDARGRPDEPIVFTARRRWLKWGAIGVVEAGPSRFEHLRVEHARWARVNGIDLPGALSLVETDAEIRASEFRHSFGKDAIHARGAHVQVEGNLVLDAYRDGLDLDQARGRVVANRFVDCRDEGIDLSGDMRELEVSDNEILDARGGRFAAESQLERIRALNRFGYSEARHGEG